MNSRAHPLLDALFRARPEALERIVYQDRDGFVRGQAESLLADVEGRPISGLDKLAEDSAAHVLKLHNLLAEIRFAILFAKLGARVEILRDRAFGGGDVYTPDLRVTFDEGLELLIEVLCTSSGDPDVTSRLQEQIDANRIPFRVTSMLGESLSIAPLRGQARTQSEALAQRAVDHGVQAMVRAAQAGERFGTVHVVEANATLRSILAPGNSGRLPHADDVPLRVGEKWMASFLFEPSPLESGYASGGVTSVHYYDDDGQAARFMANLEAKAKRRARLPAEYTETPFVVAVQNEDVELSVTTVLSTLTGSRCHSTSSAAVREAWLKEGREKYPQRAIAALQSEWGSVLEAWGYGLSARDLLTSFGAYLEEAWAANLSGVLITHRSGTRLQWLPNPFAMPAIKKPALLSIGLPLAALGVDPS